MSTTEADRIYRFIFEHAEVSGEEIHLSNVLKGMTEFKKYPYAVAKLLAECTVAVALLADTMKIKGSISLSMSQSGALIQHLNVACRNSMEVKAVAVHSVTDNEPHEFRELIGKNGVMAITVIPDDGDRYQGMVPVAGNGIADCMTEYFQQSEQLAAKFMIFAAPDAPQGPEAGGVMLRVMPSDNPSKRKEDFSGFCMLLDTLKPDEVYTLPGEKVITRLFGAEGVTIFNPHDIVFRCDCSRERCLGMLKALGRNEAENVIAQNGGRVSVRCDCCGRNYSFGADEIRALF